MKNLIFVLAIISSIILIFAFTTQEEKSIGAIGDVKYSVLPPQAFKVENGKGWVLMDDNIPLENSKLKIIHHIDSVPDARGMFIRGLDKNGKNGDVFFKEEGRPRTIQDPQKDAIENHRHAIQAYETSKHAHKDGGSIFITLYADKKHSYRSVDRISYGVKEGEKKSTETRPKNIALYVYIKIND